MRLVRNAIAFLIVGALGAQATSIVDRHGALQVVGTQVVDQSGKPLQLTGVSFGETAYWKSFYNKSVVDWLVSDWKISVLRLAVSASTGTVTTADVNAMTTALDAAVADGIYVIIDWHENNASLHTAKAQAFFAKMAKKYGALPNVIFEIWNEPHNATTDYNWSGDSLSIKTYAEAVIPAIRQYSNNLVVVGTPFWSSDLSSPAGDPIDPTTYGNVAYTYHFYTCTHSLTSQSTLSKQIPVFASEWGTSQSNGGTTATGANDNTTCLTAGQGTRTPAATWYSSWIDPQKISSCNWSITNKGESSSALVTTASDTGSWDPAVDLSPSGVWVRNMILSHCTKDATVCPYQGVFPTSPVLAIPGTILATSFTVTDGLLTEATQEASGGQNLASVDSGDFVTYSVNAVSDDTLWFQARVADTSGGLIRLQIDGVTADTIRVYPTGGVQTWSWADGTRRVPIAAGAHTLTLQFLGAGRDLLRLQRLEVVSKRLITTVVPSQISLDNFATPLIGIGLGSIFDAGGPSLRHASTRSTAYYAIQASVPETLSVSIVASNGSPDPASVVVSKRGTIFYGIYDTLVLAPSGWTTWQTVTGSRNIPLDTGLSYLRLTFLGDTGKALIDLGALSIGTVVTQVQKPLPVHSQVSLRREGRSLRVQLPEGAAEASVEILSADGRVWARQTVSGSSALALPNTHAPLWVRVRGQSAVVLAVPPGF